jgi:hypothetical protein
VLGVATIVAIGEPTFESNRDLGQAGVGHDDPTVHTRHCDLWGQLGTHALQLQGQREPQ